MAYTNITNSVGSQPNAWSVLFRVGLGIVLVWKAVNFITDTAALEVLTAPDSESILTRNDAISIVVMGLITVISGIFIAAGRFTRIAAFIQLPVFLIGILFILGGYLERNSFELTITAFIPFLLLMLITKGNYVFSGSTFSRNNTVITFKKFKHPGRRPLPKGHRRSIFNDRFKSQLLHGILVLTTGMLVVSLSYNSPRLIQYTVGMGILFASIFALIASFNTKRTVIPKQYNGFKGLGNMFYALVILLYASTFERFVAITMLFLLYIGITELLFGFQLMAYKRRISMTVNTLKMIPGLLMAISAVVFLMFATFDKSSSLLVAGVIIVLSGVHTIWFTRLTKRLGQPY